MRSRIPSSRARVDRDDVVHLECEMGVGRWLVGAFEHVHLEGAGAKPLHGKAEVGGQQGLEPEDVDVEANGLLEVSRDDADVVQADGTAHGV